MTHWLLAQNGPIIYLGLAALVLSSTIGFPPEDLTLFLAGILLSRGNVGTFIIFCVCYIGILLGDLSIFATGRRLGPALFEKPWFKSRLSETNIEKVRAGLEKRSLPMIFVARHLLYFRTITFLSCGAVRMDPLRFILADAIAAFVSVPIMLTLGYIAGENYEVVLKTVREFQTLFAIVVLCIVGLAAYIIRKKRIRLLP